MLQQIVKGISQGVGRGSIVGFPGGGTPGVPVDLWGDLVISHDFSTAPLPFWEDNHGNNWIIGNSSGVSFSQDADTPASSGTSIEASASTTTAHYINLRSPAIAALASATDFTLIVWLKQYARDVSWLTWFGIGDTAGSGAWSNNGVYADSFGAQPADRWSMRHVSSGAVNFISEYSPTMDITTWNMFTLRWDNTNTNWYLSVNDNHKAAVDGSSRLPYFGATASIVLGSFTSVSPYSNTRMDCVRLFNVLKTDADIDAHYNSGTALGYLETP